MNASTLYGKFAEPPLSQPHALAVLFQQQEGDACDVEVNKRRRLHSVAASPAQAASKLVLLKGRILSPSSTDRKSVV